MHVTSMRQNIFFSQRAIQIHSSVLMAFCLSSSKRFKPVEVRKIIKVTFSTDLDPCLKGRKCKLEHQICKKIKGLYLCDCSEGFYHGFRKCEGNPFNF